ncbi:hypothetical protein BD324DRAFT_628157 [Kockovaella imperatae]|uniref:Uncharacterized protein n=1 Tax=Kockovaella imperatae TaxID=4999 RepID=A0A1Y1UFJ9_9TREE|nr:hypothetical protein BD324DRAFT_628157 [Kockovaella imperatae]ORX36284.1 hypothetical protein BD324DRAFT_628157 [Kockovaella imperatae]
MRLCQNRPDGGFSAHVEFGGQTILSTCFDDTILIPLGSWAFILFTGMSFLIFRRRGQASNVGDHLMNHGGKDVELSTATNHHPSHLVSESPATTTTSSPANRSTYPRLRKTLLVIITFLLVALVAMHALEIARLSANHQGIGLLPFVFVPLLLIIVSLYVPTTAWSRDGFTKPARPHGLVWLIGVTLYCLWMSATYGVKIWSLKAVYNVIGMRAYDGVNSQYKESDKVVDSVTILAVYYVFMMLYVNMIFFEYNVYGWKRFW